jgi:ABC-type multidrug transport system ATPase subunit
MTPAVISTQGLTRRFGELVAVSGVSFDVGASTIFGLLGPNGSGKSTIIRMLCGVLRPSDGGAQVLGVDVRRDPEQVKRRIGYMSQRFSLYGDLSVQQNLDFYARVYGLSRERHAERVAAVVTMTGLAPFMGRLAAHLSGGWKQRLALACAFVHEPEVVFLDEPTAGIDPVARRDLWDLFFELSSRGVTLFVTTHYMDEAERCTHVGYMYAARLIALGRPDELKRGPEVTPSGTRRYELICTDPMAALTRTRGLHAIRDATMFGDRIHVLVDERLGAAELVAELAPGDGHARCEPADPTLEDVFVLLTRRREAERRG